MPNTVLEAMSYSLPVVITDVGDNSIIIEKKQFICKPKDVNEICFNLEQLVKNQNLRIESGKTNYDKTVSSYSINAFRNNYKELIESL